MQAIVIMAREPEPGKVKTRLTPPLDPETASQLYHAFLLDKIEQVKGVEGADHMVAFTPGSSRQFFQGITPPDFEVIAQEGGDLGERLAFVSNSLFDRGYERVVIVDSDTPNLPPQFLYAGFEELKKTDIVLGPCEDGGYYLIGLSSRLPQIFKDIPWSTSGVTKTTIKRARSLGRTITLLGEWYDVDTMEDLLRLKLELHIAFGGAQEIPICRNTYEILSRIL